MTTITHPRIGKPASAAGLTTVLASFTNETLPKIANTTATGIGVDPI
jgi:hypothetical protein